MASAFANAGTGQFGQDSNYQAGSGGGGFLAGLAVQKSGLEDYLNKLGVSYSGGKLSAYKQPAGSVAPDVNPYANTGMPANQMGAVPPINPANPNDQVAQSTPVMPQPSTSVTELGKLSDFNNYDSNAGHGVLDIGMKLMGL